MRLLKRWGTAGLLLVLAAGWGYRELALARTLDQTKPVASSTINLEQLKVMKFEDKGQPVGTNGVYFSGDTPASAKFVTGRFVLSPGKTPHPPHTHTEEEVMIIESGHGEIFCDGKTTEVGPGSVMYTTPNAPHGVTNTGESPLVFYYVKWESRK
jgi:mannose-6-phosphate isomerase-like protein (cupin superfamily)